MSDTRTRMIPHGGYVVVCDGRKALVLRNVSVHPKPDLQVQLAFEAPPNPPTHAQGTDRPPRVRLGDQRSAIAQTDWHDLAERRFAKAVAHALDAFDPVTALIVVAPPKTLAEMRRALPERLRRVVVAEVDKDLTKHPVEEIERCLANA
ncbi:MULTISPECIES: host attachment protein [Methylobacterium]|nr:MULTISPECIES: host attachment protein [Methylobacterium]KOX48893.1 host cell attachment protein [Streptomyces purpurogeneiscleroticus]AWV19414.1 host cell attachment protein [Methylobacterium sp. XJLW]MBA9064824.1 protein required for attachment to host cells [Methylobacterium fujisawaense]MBP30517.1 host attachment protein [Methylobacterium sp.]MDE4911397.1 host attachment protein [Methylobacterium sp. 092160098-2]